MVLKRAEGLGGSTSRTMRQKSKLSIHAANKTSVRGKLKDVVAKLALILSFLPLSPNSGAAKFKAWLLSNPRPNGTRMNQDSAEDGTDWRR